MEGKTVILCVVLIVSLAMAQLQVEAKSCCPSTSARNIYKVCRFTGQSRNTCASLSGCKIQSSTTCPSGFDKLTQQHSGEGITEYCKLGCVSSVCNVMSALENSDASGIVNGAVSRCTESCSTFCAKRSVDALEIASSI